MDDLQSKFVAGVISLVLAAAAWLKSHTEVKDIKADREKTKNERDTKIALLEQKVKMLEDQRKEDAERYEKQLLDIVARFEKRLEEGSVRFDRFDSDMKTMSDKLTTIITKFDTLLSIKSKSHIPESEPL